MSGIQFTLWLLVLFGHVALWVALFNRLHAWAVPLWVLESVEKIYMAVAALGAVFWIWKGLGGIPPGWPQLDRVVVGNRFLTSYATVSCVVGLIIGSAWVLRRLGGASPSHLLSNDTQCIRVSEQLEQPLAGGRMSRLFAWIPGQQMFDLHIHEKRLAFATLPDAFDQLVIAHVSDLHLTGQIRRPYFDYLIDRVNELDADLVAITGDLIDDADCLSWLSPTLGRLRARHGVYFVLGNHDLREGRAPEIRRILTDAGLIDLGGRCLQIAVRGTPLRLAGNELPWFSPEPELPWRAAGGVFSLMLAHTPDQFPWARRHGFDLMLAGHTHGGQIRFPLVGPIVAPSLYGVRYASGLFYAPPTLMHVTRGISGREPIRWNCPPELAKLVLVKEQARSGEQ